MVIRVSHWLFNDRATSEEKQSMFYSWFITSNFLQKISNVQGNRQWKPVWKEIQKQIRCKICNHEKLQWQNTILTLFFFNWKLNQQIDIKKTVLFYSAMNYLGSIFGDTVSIRYNTHTNESPSPYFTRGT